MPRRLPARRQMVRRARQGSRDAAENGRDFVDDVEAVFQESIEKNVASLCEESAFDLRSNDRDSPRSVMLGEI